MNGLVQKIKRAKQEREMTDAELGELTGYSRANVNSFLNGKLKPPVKFLVEAGKVFPELQMTISQELFKEG